ncbi:dGTPase [Photobacterium leiognathi subsp. mandapamensis]|uniref:anti-phage deoxyguanosine triphosphatase n=1 Tax=Photobacterium leiognathi TaxID=553611 RepID=UPI000D16B14A|nr:anti-phage deoxyguanosine triphosphatase [Photobacterium leiognathi]PSW66474.1 dGTPase [Photobacterium leiognathi subsp. mandapamensis]
MNIEKLQERLFSNDSNDTLEYRTNYFRDRSRLVHSAAFRRLQGKTQVLGLGESDFYRTRLTHSMEVASLSQSIAKFIQKSLDSKFDLDEIEVNELTSLLDVEDYSYLLEAIGLAHDIGHPPFGHGGERALHKKMFSFGGFEGNAQTLRILNELAEYDEHHGLNPSIRLALGVLKYPVSFENATEGVEDPKPPKCIYKKDYDILSEKLKDYFDLEDLARFFETEKGELYQESQYKSFDCAIMELADDISYAVHDLEDGVALKLLTADDFEYDKLQKLFDDAPNNLKPKISSYNNAESFILYLCGKGNKSRKKCINTLIYLMINSIEIEKDNMFKSPLFKYKPKLSEWAKELKKYFFSAVKEGIIKSAEVQHLELKGEMIVEELFEILKTHPESLLEPKDRIKVRQNPNNVERIVCDYIAGMTDAYATRIYKRIFMPDSGSVFDRL